MGSDNTPILVGVGQSTQAVPEDLTQCMSFADLAAEAAGRAIADCGPAISASIDTIAAVRTFEDSVPGTPPFGRTTNLGGSVAVRLGLNPSRTIYEVLGGQSPQKLVGEFSESLHRGECHAVLLCGAEVIASIRALKKAVGQGFAAPDWSEQPDFNVEDRGPGIDSKLIGSEDIRHRLMQPMQFYALMENARRGATKLSRRDYRTLMGELFAPFTRVAARNPHAFFRREYTPEALVAAGPQNPMLVEPYSRNLVSKDGVNQAAAVVMTTVARARQLGIDEQKWVYLHAYADRSESHLLEREELGASVAMEAAIGRCLQRSRTSAADIAHYDIYSCFPVVVFEAAGYLGLDAAGQQLTQTGGLPYFGGPGSNYSMHGIASLVETLRRDRGALGLLLANGGWMSKCSVGIYSTTPVSNWEPDTEDAVAADIRERNNIEIEPQPHGDGVIETYTVDYVQNEPVRCVIIARLNDGRRRCYGISDDPALAQRFADDEFEPLGRPVLVTHDPAGNGFRLL